jgi:NitT/TauT family transport system substrate-binding protein
MNKKWFYPLFAALLIVPVVLSACGKNDETIKIRVGEVTRSIFYAPEYVALAKGFFQEEGLDVDLSTIAGGDKVMATLLSGGIDVALVGSETSIYVYQQGADDPVINFAQLTQTDGTFLVSRKPIEKFSWSLLKGVLRRKGLSWRLKIFISRFGQGSLSV